MLTTREAAARLDIEPRSVVQLIKRGLIAAQKHGRDYSIEPAEIERYTVERQPRHRPRKETMIGNRVFHANGVTVGFIENERLEGRECQVDWQCGTPREWRRIYLASLEPQPAIVHTTDSGKQITPIE